jgi:phosphoribosyl 1,2-cyclic phosphodiesterase
MKFEQLYSSSSGNLYIVESSNNKRLLLEAGITWKKLQKALKYDLSNIEACFVTHSHADHSKAIYDVVGAGIEVYASEETLSFMGLNMHRRTKIIKDKDLIRLKDFQVFAFSLNHDADGTLGFIVRAVEENEYLLFAPDTSFITQRFSQKFNIIALECSFDKTILQNRVDTNDINETLAKRLLTSHLEKSETMRYIEKFCDISKLTQINLLHLSKNNIDAKKVQKEFQDKFLIETIICS